MSFKAAEPRRDEDGAIPGVAYFDCSAKALTEGPILMLLRYIRDQAHGRSIEAGKEEFEQLQMFLQPEEARELGSILTRAAETAIAARARSGTRN